MGLSGGRPLPGLQTAASPGQSTWVLSSANVAKPICIFKEAVSKSDPGLPCDQPRTLALALCQQTAPPQIPCLTCWDFLGLGPRLAALRVSCCAEDQSWGAQGEPLCCVQVFWSLVSTLPWSTDLSQPQPAPEGWDGRLQGNQRLEEAGHSCPNSPWHCLMAQGTSYY